jgi:hypothetical protein
MTGMIRRFAMGYPVLSYLYVVAYYASNATSTFSMTAGPGEILGFSAFKFSGTDADYALLNVVITIDGVAVFSGAVRDLMATSLLYAENGMFCSHAIRDADVCASSFRLTMPYEVSASLVFKNLSANQLGLGFSVPVRRGA